MSGENCSYSTVLENPEAHAAADTCLAISERLRVHYGDIEAMPGVTTINHPSVNGLYTGISEVEQHQISRFWHNRLAKHCGGFWGADKLLEALREEQRIRKYREWKASQ